MPEEKSGYVYFEGIIPDKKDKKGELAMTEAAFLIQFEIPNELTGVEEWIPKSQVIELKQEGNVIRGKVARWLLEKKFSFEMEVIESAQTTVEVIKPYEGTDASKKVAANDRTEIAEMKQEYEGLVGDILPKKGMQFKEISVSLGEKLSADFQSKNVQIGAVVILGGYSVDLAYTTARNYVIQKVKEEVKRIREEML